MIITTLVFIAGLGTIYMVGTQGVGQCKAEFKEQKQISRDKKLKARRIIVEQQRKARENATPSNTPKTSPNKSPANDALNNSFGGMFTPNNLGSTVDSKSKAEKEPSKSDSNGLFSPQNLTAPSQ